jgi:hypothetical protein
MRKGFRFPDTNILNGGGDISAPTAFTSSFVVDTILGQLNWTNNAGSTAQYEIYSSTNGATDVLLATTAAGATSYQDTTCKQNASVVYKIRVKEGTKFSDMVSASALATPLCWKTNQSTLAAHVINDLIIAAGKTVTVNYSDGTSQSYAGANTNIVKNFNTTGQYNIWLTGDTDSITALQCFNQPSTYGVVTNWVLPATLTYFRIYSTLLTGNVTNWVLPATLTYFFIYATSLTGDVTNWVLPANLANFYIYNTNCEGKLPQITASNNQLKYRTEGTNITDSNVTVFRKGMTAFNASNPKLPFSTANLDKLLKAIADWYQTNAPTANCTYTLNGANMGTPTGGASNADIARIVSYYSAAGKTATIIVRTS